LQFNDKVAEFLPDSPKIERHNKVQKISCFIFGKNAFSLMFNVFLQFAKPRYNH